MKKNKIIIIGMMLIVIIISIYLLNRYYNNSTENITLKNIDNVFLNDINTSGSGGISNAKFNSTGENPLNLN